MKSAHRAMFIVALPVSLAMIVAMLLLRPDDPPATLPTTHSPATVKPTGWVEAPEMVREEVAGGAPTASARVVGGDLPPPIDLGQADRETELAGVVVDEQGRPIGGAEVQSVSFPWRRLETLNVAGHYQARLGARTLAAKDGTFALTLCRGEVVTLQISAPAYATAVLPDCLAGEHVRVILLAAAALEVVTVDESGRAVAGVHMRFWKHDPGGAIFDQREGTTRDDGRCVFFDLAPGTATISLDHPVLGSPSWQHVSIKRSGTTTHKVTMPTGRTVHGRVVDAVTHQPIAGASVGANWVLDRPVRTGEDGGYAFLGWTGIGVDDLHVTVEGYGRQGKRVPSAGDVDFELMPGDRVEGRVLSASGRPVTGARITAIASARVNGAQEIDSVSAETGNDGSLVLTSLRRDLAHTLAVQAAGHGRLLIDFDPHPAGPGVIDLGDIVLPVARRIEGKVLGPDGEPIARSPITISGCNADRGRLRPSATQPAHGDFYGKTETRRTDDLGRFRFCDLSAGEYQLTAKPTGMPSMSRTVQLAVDVDLLDVVFQVAESRVLIVRATDRAGAPLAEISILAVPVGAKDRVSAVTDEAGRAVLGGLPESPVRVECYAFDRYLSPGPVEVTPQGQEVTLVLREASRVEGTVVAPDGTLLAGMLVRATAVDSRDLSTFTDDEGRFVIQAPLGEQVDLLVTGQRTSRSDGRSQGKSPYRGQLPGVIAPATDVVLRTTEVRLDAKLRVLVFDADDRPAASARVNVSAVDAAGKTLVTDAGGRAAFEGLSNDEVCVRAFQGQPSSDLTIPSEPLRVMPAGQEVELHLRRGVALIGTVVDPQGSPASGIHVMAVHQDDIFSSISDTRGRFRIAVAPGTTYDLRASHPKDKNLTGSRSGVTPGSDDVNIKLGAWK